MIEEDQQPLRVLLAEDDQVAQQIIVKQLEGWGCEVEAYSDGARAMMAIRSADAPSLAILDWEMPEMDGLEICKRVKQVQWPVYIIMLTCHESREDLVRALEAGAHDYISKPCDPRELYARMRVGARTIRLQRQLEAKIEELKYATHRITELEDRI